VLLFFFFFFFTVLECRLEYDEERLHLGVALPFSYPGVPSESTAQVQEFSSLLLVTTMQSILELGKYDDPPKRVFVMGCAGPPCEVTNSSVILPSSIPLAQPPHSDMFKIQYHLLDTQWDGPRAAQIGLDFGFGRVDKAPPMNAMIGPGSDSELGSQIPVTTLMETVQISSLATADVYTNKLEYPYLFRTVSGQSGLGNELVDYMLYFQWRGANCIIEDIAYGNAIRIGMVEAARAAGRSDDLAIFTITASIIDDLDPIQLAEMEANVLEFGSQFVRNHRREHRLIFFVFYNDARFGTILRRQFFEEGLCAPRYQYVTTIAATLGLHWGLMAGHRDWHGFTWSLDFTQPAFLTYLTTWFHLTPEDITSLFEETGVLDWGHDPDLTLVDPAAFQSLNSGITLGLSLMAAFGAFFNAFNDMLHAGYRPSEIHGDRLKEFLSNVTQTAYGAFYDFNANQDFGAPSMVQYSEGYETEGSIAWHSFAVRTPVEGSILGEMTMLEAHPDGPMWATGNRSWGLPEEIAGCEPGWWNHRRYENDIGECLLCPGGTYSSQYSANHCDACAGGTFSAEGSTACDTCQPGSFALTNQTICTACFTGTYTAGSGASSCTDCTVGMFQNGTRSTQCRQCPPGTFASTQRSDKCLPCEQGTYASDWGQSICRSCPAGTFQAKEGQDECLDCEPGTFQEEEGRSGCAPCRAGTFQPNRSSAMPCEVCDVATFTEMSGSTGCEECHYGTTLLKGADRSGLCTCPAGTFAYFSGDMEIPECIPCNEYLETCEGGDGPAYQLKGYQVSLDARHVYQCASVDACPGGQVGSCPVGSSGPGCATCDSSNYWDGDKCSKCTGANTAFIALMPVCLVLMVFFTYRFGNDPIAHSISNMSEFIVLAGLSMSIFFFFSAFSALDVKWKEPVNTLLKLSVFLSTEFTNVHVTCSVAFSGAASLALTSAVPLGILIPSILLSVFGFASAKKLFNTFATIIYAAYLLLLLHALKPFRYIVHPVGNTKSLLFMPQVFQGSAEHMGMVVVGIAVIAVYCIPFAAGCVWAAWGIKWARHAGQRRWYLVTFRFLFYKFRPHAYYWGICILGRNALFALSPSIFPEQPGMAVWCLSAVAIISAVHTGFVGPWRAQWMNYADTGILIYVALVLNVAVGWVRKDEDSDGLLSTFLAVVAMLGAVVVSFFSVRLFVGIACASKQKREEMRLRIQEKQAAIEQHFMEEMADEEDITAAMDELYAKPTPYVNKQPTVELSIPAALRWVSTQPFDLAVIGNIAKHIREKDYSLQNFFEDCLHGFPELWLYSTSDGSPSKDSKANKTRRRSQAEVLSSGDQEQLRTYGALFAVYWGCRLDMDGKRGLAFGMQDDNPHKIKDLKITKEELAGIGWGKMTPDQRRANLYHNFDWDLLTDLFMQSGLTYRTNDGKIMADTRPDGRLVAMLCLTAFHDIMKNPILCPIVLKEPYEGHIIGEVIKDHDLALAYVLDRYPDVLPSYRDLSAEQQKAVRFTQSEMGFNAGWLVQAEGPPSTVLGKLKKAIARGFASSDADVAFYFAHWVTDLAGAEPTPFLGTEKFAVKFPPPVLQGLLGCFSIVKSLADGTETEIYERYLVTRWKAAEDLLGPVPQGPERTARLRLHCMGQAGAKTLLDAFGQLPEDDRALLSRELAETGMPGQEFSEWDSAGGPQLGTPFLTYYGPAWCQRVGQTDPLLCLRTLAMVFRLCRMAYPESINENSTELAFGSRTVQLAALKTVDLDDLKVVLEEVDLHCLEVVQDNRLECTLKINMVSA